MHTTSRLTLEVPDGTDLESAFPSVSSNQMGTLDNAVLVTEGTISNRPSATAVEKDHIYKATDTGVWYLSDGTNWNTVLVAGAWQALALSTNINSTGYGASARLEGDTVRLRGTLSNGTASTVASPIATIPAGLRPSVSINLPAVFITGASASTSDCPISTSGQITTPLGANGSLCLDGLTYTL